ncbi:MAG: lysine transporter LysE [Gammaproteobacteria bacterium]|nr:MAG: lysine transporter LysE [Gammaproteobacteria bacterium]
MEKYSLYLIISALTIASPGPGVILTLTTSLKFGLFKTLPAIVGVASGMLVISIIAGSGVGLLIATHANLYSALKLLGALYLLYLSYKLFLATKKHYQLDVQVAAYHPRRLFYAGFLITMANPKPIIFFVALFPQFIDKDYFWVQFILYSLSFCGLIVIIHGAYGYIAHTIRKQSSDHFFRYVNLLGAMAYCFFAVALIYSEALYHLD